MPHCANRGTTHRDAELHAEAEGLSVEQTICCEDVITEEMAQ